MSAHQEFAVESAHAVGWGVRVLVLAAAESDALVSRVAGLGMTCDVETELFAALAALIDDPSGYGLFVMDCDTLGGAAAAGRALAHLAAVQSRVPVVLVSRDHAEQHFPEDRSLPVRLRAPLSPVSLRIGAEHALRDRLMWRAA